MVEWLSDLNWWGAFGMLCGIGLGTAYFRYASTKTAEKPDCTPVK